MINRKKIAKQYHDSFYFSTKQIREDIMMEVLLDIRDTLVSNNESHQTKQTVQTGSGDKPEVCENRLSGSQQRVKTGDVKVSKEVINKSGE